MANKSGTTWLTDEVAEFLASCPSPDELLAFRPSSRAVQSFNALLANSKTGSLGADEEWELDQFEHIEMLMQSIKARLRPAKPEHALFSTNPQTALHRAKIQTAVFGNRYHEDPNPHTA